MIGLFNIPPGSPLDFQCPRPRFFDWSGAPPEAIYERFEQRNRAKTKMVQYLRDGRRVSDGKVQQAHSPNDCWQQTLTRSSLLIRTRWEVAAEEGASSSSSLQLPQAPAASTTVPVLKLDPAPATNKKRATCFASTAKPPPSCLPAMVELLLATDQLTAESVENSRRVEGASAALPAEKEAGRRR